MSIVCGYGVSRNLHRYNSLQLQYFTSGRVLSDRERTSRQGPGRQGTDKKTGSRQKGSRQTDRVQTDRVQTDRHLTGRVLTGENHPERPTKTVEYHTDGGPTTNNHTNNDGQNRTQPNTITQQHNTLSTPI